MNSATKTNWISGLEYEIAGMLTGASWDPIDVAQALVNDWCKAVAA